MRSQQGKNKKQSMDDMRTQLPVRPPKTRYGHSGRSGVYRGWRRVAYSPVALVPLVLVALLMSRAVWNVYSRWDLARMQRNEVSAKLTSQELRQKQLEQEVQNLSTERGVEEELRRSYQVAKPGEGVIILVGTSTDSR